MGYRIGEVAEHIGLPLTTLRYYEDRGLLPPPRRNAAGHRVYDRHHLERLEIMVQAKRMGLSLEEAGILADAWQNEPCSITHAQLVEFLDRKLGEVRDQIAELSAFARRLQEVTALVAGQPTDDEGCGPGCGCAPAFAPRVAGGLEG